MISDVAKTAMNLSGRTIFLLSSERGRSMEPIDIANLVSAGKVIIIGAHYDLETGLVTLVE